MSSDHKFQTQIRALHLLIGAGGELEHRIYPFAAFKWEKKKEKKKFSLWFQHHSLNTCTINLSLIGIYISIWKMTFFSNPSTYVRLTSARVCATNVLKHLDKWTQKSILKFEILCVIGSLDSHLQCLHIVSVL